MGIFDNYSEEPSDKLYEDVKKYLKPRNGKKQVILVTTKTKTSTYKLECDNKYTLEVGKLLEEMQNEGYEILDVKIETLATPGSSIAVARTLVIYK